MAQAKRRSPLSARADGVAGEADRAGVLVVRRTEVAARAALLGKGATNVKFVTLAVNHENLNALVRLLQTDHVRVVIEQTYPFDKTASAVTHALGHHARGKVAIVL